MASRKGIFFNYNLLLLSRLPPKQASKSVAGIPVSSIVPLLPAEIFPDSFPGNPAGSLLCCLWPGLGSIKKFIRLMLFF
jgi:hypothetical protein